MYCKTRKKHESFFSSLFCNAEAWTQALTHATDKAFRCELSPHLPFCFFFETVAHSLVYTGFNPLCNPAESPHCDKRRPGEMTVTWAAALTTGAPSTATGNGSLGCRQLAHLMLQSQCLFTSLDCEGCHVQLCTTRQVLTHFTFSNRFVLYDRK